MFSGIVEEIGSLEARRGTASSFRLEVRAEKVTKGIEPSHSIAVCGVCLTVESTDRAGFTVYASPETISRTTLANKSPGSPVNLERALLASSRIGGHFVLGHVDGVGQATHIRREADAWRFAFKLPENLMADCVEKGSIAIEGISLTIAAMKSSGSDSGRPDTIEVAVIPFTFENTTFNTLKPGDPVNVETDIFAKYARKFLAPHTKNEGITEDLLKQAGFME